MLDFFGFSPKYILPSNISGRIVTSCRIYFGEDEIINYTYDKKKKKACILYASKNIRKMVEEYIKELSLQYNVPSEPQDFILRMFSFVEVQHYIRQELKEGSDGIIVVYNKDNGDVDNIVPVKKCTDAFFKKVQETYPTKKAMFLGSGYKTNIEIEKVFDLQRKSG